MTNLLHKSFEIYNALHDTWHAYFLDHFGIKRAEDLKSWQTLVDGKVLKNIAWPGGFEDFGGRSSPQFIVPGRPALSVFFHALASPAVVIPGLDQSNYPKEPDLETVENFVVARAELSLADVRQIAGGSPLAIAVFAKQYRVARETTHGLHADFVFSRTGVARVGNEGVGPDSDRGFEQQFEQLGYDGKRRCFPAKGTEPGRIPVLPCRYAAYIAVKMQGRKDLNIPGRFRNGDETNSFWLPVHKLFDGDECLRDIRNLKVVLQQEHLNEKLRRIHRAVHILGFGSKYSEPAISGPPFVQKDVVQSFLTHPDGGSALVVPWNKIVEPVMIADGQPVTVTVFPSVENTDASLRLFPRPRRWAPEFVHVRSKVTEDGVEDLNRRANVSGIVMRGGYEAAHFRDFTGDGWVKASCPKLAAEVPLSLAAYSLIAPPDLMPNVRQSDLMDWYERGAPDDIKNDLWNGTSPTPLCDHRVAANQELPGSVFSVSDITITALVGPLQIGSEAQVQRPVEVSSRTTTLTDASSGIFAPGSDVGLDESPKRIDEHGNEVPIKVFLSNYGMGSPFLEDTKLCAAQSAFWPGTTPDTARVYEPFPNQPTVTPLLDSELAWDGSPMPKILREPTDDRAGEVEHRSRSHTDYITQFARADFGLLHAIGTQEYVNRTITMARIYQSLSSPLVEIKTRWVVLNCQRVDPEVVRRDIAGGAEEIPRPSRLGGPERVTGAAVLGAMTESDTDSYRFVIYSPVGKRPGEQAGTFIVSFFETLTIYANPTSVYIKRDGFWEQRRF